MSFEVMANDSIEGRNNASPDIPDVSHMDYPGVTQHKPLWEMIVKTLFYFPVIVFGIIGNVIIIAVVAKNKRMQASMNCPSLFSLDYFINSFYLFHPLSLFYISFIHSLFLYIFHLLSFFKSFIHSF